MAATAVYKVRCPACGKSLRIDGNDAGTPLACRACGALMLTAIPPLLGPFGTDPSALPVLEATLLNPGAFTPPTADPVVGGKGSLASSDEVAVPGPAELGTRPEEASAADVGAELSDVTLSEAAGNLRPAAEASWEPPLRPPVSHQTDTDDAAGTTDRPPWAAAPVLPDTPPPSAKLPVATLELTGATPGSAVATPRLTPTRVEPGDPDLEQVRLAMVPPWIPAPVATPQPAAAPHDALADTDIHPALQDGAFDGSPSNSDVRMVQAAHRAGQVRLVGGGPRRHGHPVWWTLLGMLSAAAAVLLVLLATGQVDWFSPWEKRAYPTIAQYKAEAEALALRGAMNESHERYKKIDELVAGRAVRDVRLAEIVEAARQDGQRVYAVLLSRMANASSPPTSSPGPPATDSASSATDGRPADNSSADVRSGQPEDSVPTSRPEMSSPGIASVMPDGGVAKDVASGGVLPSSTARPATGTPTPGAASRPSPQSQPARQGFVVEPPRVRPAPRPARRDEDAPLTDAEIGESIQAGVNFLLKRFDPKTNLVESRERNNDPAYFAGLDALAVYALLQAGQAIEDPRISHRGAEMKARLEALRALPMDGSHQTYARGLRATCLALFNRPEDFKVMAGDVDWLLGTSDGGAYSYSSDYRTITQRGNFASRSGSWDNSNSQYGLLGVWSGIEADPRVEVPLAYWRAVDRHWTGCQLPDGQWGYGQGGSGSGRLTMTCAGIASLFVAHEYLEPPVISGTVGREPFSPALRKGLEWFERGNNSVNVRGGNWWGYTLYGIERVGLASGFKHFGTHDWYRELAEHIVRRQLTNGSWGDGVVDTSYAVLFLSRGRHPILMNKLRFDGYWSNRPRDAANMARFAGRQFERPINWQVVNADNPWTDWSDSPILYIASHEPPRLTDDHLEKLRRFARSGGMIFTHADAGSPTFDTWARELAAKLFPYELTAVPDNHPVWSSVYKLTSRPELLGVSNGSRLLMVHSPSDVTLKWQQGADRSFESRPDPARPAAIVTPDSETKTRMLSSFHLGMNLFVYAAGKRDLRNRLDSAWTERPTSTPIDIIRIARIQYGGNWDPEPGAWERYGNWFHQATGTRLDVQQIKIGDLSAETVSRFPLAHLTGTARVGFTDRDAAALKSYVEAGGVVLIDPTGGMNAFDAEVRESLLVKAFPDRFARLLDGGHPLMTDRAPGMEDVGKTIVRGYTLERLGGGIGTIQMITPRDADRTGSGQRPGAVIVTSLDLTSGLLGTNVWGILGFQNKYAQSFVKNVVFWTVDGRPQQ